MAAAYVRSSEHLARWEPIRPEIFYTVSGQEEVIGPTVEDQRQGRGAVRVLVNDETIVGQVTLSNVARGVFQS